MCIRARDVRLDAHNAIRVHVRVILNFVFNIPTQVVFSATSRI